MNNTLIDEILNTALKHNASDIHIKADIPPYMRIDGELIKMDLPALDDGALQKLILNMLNADQKTALTTKKELDFSFRSAQDYQFRVNVCYSQGELAINFRITNSNIKTIEELGLPLVVEELCKKRKGLVLISGTAGSGKSTTLTYMVDYINRTRRCKIITVEDPIEYIHQSKNSFVLQREVGSDTESFIDALKYALRQDPDVLVVGEIRDLESIAMALTSAETGHLVFATVHASDSVETINRIIDVFPVDRRQQINVQLSSTLIGVIAQSLLPQKTGNGRVLATEVMISNIAIQNLISRGALNEIRGQLDANINGPSYSLGRCLADLIRRDLITKEVAKQFIKNTADLDYHMKSNLATPLNRLTQAQMDNIMEKSIVVIDRDQKQRIQVQERLKAKGFLNVYTLPKNAETMEKVQFLRPDIVVLDALHEFMLTADFCREIKALDCNPKLLVIADDTRAAEIIAATQAPGAESVVVRSSESELLIKAITKIDFTNKPIQN